MESPHYFCVDAGASRSRGRLYDSWGAELASVQSGPANASYDCEQAVASVLDLWRQACAAVRHDPRSVSSTIFSIGGAGLYVPQARQAFVSACPSFAMILTMSDGYAALVGAGRGKPGALLTVGTGVAGHRLFADGSSIQRDGWGWIVGDRGSGSWMGVRAVRHTLEVCDGIAAQSALSRAVMAHIGGAQGLLGGAFSKLDAPRIASFAPLVLESAEEGCAVAVGILSRALDHLADLVSALRCEDVSLFLNGGLGAALKPKLVERLGRSIIPATADPLEGCLLVARGDAPPEQAIFAWS